MVKEMVDKQVPVGHFLSMMKGAVLRFRPEKLAFVGIGGRRKIREEVAVEELFPLAGGRPDRAVHEDKPKKRFDFGSILRLRTFAFLIIGTVLLVVYINNLLTINALSRENEILRERIGISRSINAAFELRLQELQAIHNISVKAEEMGLKARITPAITIGGE